VSAVTYEEGKTGSQRDGRAAHGAARVGDRGAESPFFHGVEPERRVRMRPAAIHYGPTIHGDVWRKLAHHCVRYGLVLNLNEMPPLRARLVPPSSRLLKLRPTLTNVAAIAPIGNAAPTDTSIR
jgi:hypothetical protein